MKHIKLTDIEGIRVGHAHDLGAGTGCTVIWREGGATGGVDVRGGAPGTRETDLLDPVNMVDQVHAVLLAGGSVFGLDAAAGVMEFLEQRGCGFDVGVTRAPIVVGAALFDLAFGDHRVRPDKEMGLQACQGSLGLEAGNSPIPEGNVGAGAGATLGKCRGMEFAMKGGLGTCCFQVDQLKVGALVVVNCFGDVVSPKSTYILAGALDQEKKDFVDAEKVTVQEYALQKNVFSSNTTLGVVATNARLSKAQANKLASMAHNGFARTIRPVHTMYDGDTVFTLATGEIEADLNAVGILAVKAVEEAVINGVTKAESHLGLPAFESRVPF